MSARDDDDLGFVPDEPQAPQVPAAPPALEERNSTEVSHPGMGESALLGTLDQAPFGLGNILANLGETGVMKLAHAFAPPHVQLTPQAQAEAKGAGLQVPTEADYDKAAHSTYAEAAADLAARKEAAQQEHPDAYSRGGAGMFGLSLGAPLPRIGKVANVTEKLAAPLAAKLVANGMSEAAAKRLASFAVNKVATHAVGGGVLGAIPGAAGSGADVALSQGDYGKALELAKEGGEHGAEVGAAIGGTIPMVGAVGSGLVKGGIAQGRRLISGLTSSLSNKKILPDETVEKAFQEGIIPLVGSVKGVRDRAVDLASKVGKQYEETIAKLQDKGVLGSNAAEKLAAVKQLGENAIASGEVNPNVNNAYANAAKNLEQVPVGVPAGVKSAAAVAPRTPTPQVLDAVEKTNAKTPAWMDFNHPDELAKRQPGPPEPMNRPQQARVPPVLIPHPSTPSLDALRSRMPTTLEPAPGGVPPEALSKGTLADRPARAMLPAPRGTEEIPAPPQTPPPLRQGLPMPTPEYLNGVRKTVVVPKTQAGTPPPGQWSNPADQKLAQELHDLNGSAAPERPPGNYSLQQEAKIKRSQQGLVDYDQPIDSPANLAHKDVARLYREQLHNAINDQVADSADPELQTLAKQFHDVNARDAHLIAIRDAAKSAANRFEKNAGIGLRNIMGGSALGAAGHAVAGPVGGAVGGLLGLVGPRYMTSTAAQLLRGGGKALGKIGELLQSDPAKLGPYAGPLARALQNGTLASTHFVLSQSDPRYQEHVQGLSPDGEGNE